MGHSSPGAADPAERATAESNGWYRLGFEAYGVPAHVNVDSPALLKRVESALPPGWRRREPAEDDQFFTLSRRDGVSYIVEHRNGAVSGSSDLDVALAVLESRVRAHISLHAPEYIFVHAGVVAVAGAAIMLPSASFGGKTTLVGALVRQGALYYSDEFAVLDKDGLVHPYPKHLSIRHDGLNQTDYAIGTLGGIAGREPLRVRLIALTRYVPGGQWQPRRLSDGESVLAMLANTIPAQERPAQALSTIKRAVAGAVVLEGERGEASDAVTDLLERVRRPSETSS